MCAILSLRCKSTDSVSSSGRSFRFDRTDSLDLGQNRLKGTLPTELGLLTNVGKYIHYCLLLDKLSARSHIASILQAISTSRTADLSAPFPPSLPGLVDTLCHRLVSLINNELSCHLKFTQPAPCLQALHFLRQEIS